MRDRKSRSPLQIPIPLAQLSRRQNEVLAAVVAGYSNQEIGAALGISYRTVRNHLTAIYAALGVSDRTQAAVMYVVEEMKAKL